MHHVAASDEVACMSVKVTGMLQVAKRNIERTEDLLDAYFMQVSLWWPCS